MSHNHNPVDTKMLFKELGKLHPISSHPLYSHCRGDGWIGECVGFALSTLVPHDQGKILFQWHVEERLRNGGKSRPSVQPQNDRVIPVSASYLNPLLCTANGFIHPFIDTDRNINFHYLVVTIRAICQEDGCQYNDK